MKELENNSKKAVFDMNITENQTWLDEAWSKALEKTRCNSRKIGAEFPHASQGNICWRRRIGGQQGSGRECSGSFILRAGMKV